MDLKTQRITPGEVTPLATGLRPTPGKLIVQIDPEDDKTKGGLIIPGTAIESGNVATVVAWNPLPWEDKHHTLKTPYARKGDRVVIGKYAGVEITYQGEKFTVLNQDEVLAVIDLVPVG